MAAAWAEVLALLGLEFDYAVSKNYRPAVEGSYTPAWWAGGSHFDNRLGNFGGGSFGGGGASGDW